LVVTLLLGCLPQTRPGRRTGIPALAEILT
jgi:hypothetical protein